MNNQISQQMMKSEDCPEILMHNFIQDMKNTPEILNMMAEIGLLHFEFVEGMLSNISYRDVCIDSEFRDSELDFIEKLYEYSIEIYQVIIQQRLKGNTFGVSEFIIISDDVLTYFIDTALTNKGYPDMENFRDYVEVKCQIRIEENNAKPTMTEPDYYEVLEHAGLYNEQKVARFSSLSEARKYVKNNYTRKELEELEIDITCNGSTEY